jgi:hypothetical protein
MLSASKDCDKKKKKLGMTQILWTVGISNIRKGFGGAKGSFGLIQ